MSKKRKRDEEDDSSDGAIAQALDDAGEVTESIWAKIIGKHDETASKKATDTKSSSSSSSDAAAEPKEKKMKQRVDICAGKPTQEIVYKGCTFGVDLKVMQATCKHPVYVTDEIAKAVAEGHVWNIDTAVLNVSVSAMQQFLEAVHRPFKMEQTDSFVKWAQFYIIADYIQHVDLYDYANEKCALAIRTTFHWAEWQDLIYVLMRRHVTPKDYVQEAQRYPDKAWLYGCAMKHLVQMLMEKRDERETTQKLFDNLRQIGLPQLPEAVARDVVRAMTAEDRGSVVAILETLSE